MRVFAIVILVAIAGLLFWDNRTSHRRIDELEAELAQSRATPPEPPKTVSSWFQQRMSERPSLETRRERFSAGNKYEK